MSWEPLLLEAALVLAGLLAGAFALLVVHGMWRNAADAHWRRPTAEARAALAETADRLELTPRRPPSSSGSRHAAGSTCSPSSRRASRVRPAPRSPTRLGRST